MTDIKEQMESATLPISFQYQEGDTPVVEYDKAAAACAEVAERYRIEGQIEVLKELLKKRHEDYTDEDGDTVVVIESLHAWEMKTELESRLSQLKGK